ncbi:Uncharacterised protein [Fusobacterium necrophorum subsp. necrophorum]|nr:Uncharacterised protein [Fusobacterium necrophorum subsp. necrophorum]
MVRKLKGNRPAQAAAGNQMDILKQAQAMQQQMLQVQEELKGKDLTVSVGGEL